MAEEIRIALDAMGGDNAPGEIVKGAVNALRHHDGMRIILVGKQNEIERVLREEKRAAESGSERTGKAGDGANRTGWESRLSIRNADEVIGTADHPVEAIMHKRNSSMVVALTMVKKGEADAAVSAGNSGALIVGAQGIVGRIRGVQRPPFGTLIPTRRGVSLLVDAGANVDARPQFLAQWAKLGTIYMEGSLGIRNPKVGIVNVGAEEEKGNQLVKDTFPLLKKMDESGEIHFTGSCEARDIPEGTCDVVVCDGFVGNVALKTYEGTAKLLMSVLKEALLSSGRSKVGALLIKPALKKALKKYDSSAYGGAPILGLNGLVVKMHGSSRAREVETAMQQCVQFRDQRISEKIAQYAEEEKRKQDAARAEEDRQKHDAAKTVGEG